MLGRLVQYGAGPGRFVRISRPETMKGEDARMDFYGFYMRKLENFPKEGTVRDLTNQAVRILDEGPLLAGLEAGVSLAEALRNWKNCPAGLQLMPYYKELRDAIGQALTGAELEIELADSLTAEPEPGPELEAMREDPEGPPFLDFENWPDWDTGQWVRFDYEKEEAMRAAQGGLANIGRAAELLANIRANVHKLPAEERVRLTLWTAKLADEMHDRVEEVVDEMGRANLYTREGREIQKRLARQNDQGTDGTA